MAILVDNDPFEAALEQAASLRRGRMPSRCGKKVRMPDVMVLVQGVSSRCLDACREWLINEWHQVKPVASLHAHIFQFPSVLAAEVYPIAGKALACV